ncbi:hypothetical protein ACFFMN_22865 [Planobispora siamensis]|uniref:Uncharacterized protein n=1 Tax=Planobispora siamensis TaxID=936338 RepID=A0A8J3SN73_9ACTN|nr:hypothetical protein [Planobispora siamensis]GIH95409.1 hypothetical protein Psi01_60390 [Planobispora siamensis]
MRIVYGNLPPEETPSGQQSVAFTLLPDGAYAPGERVQAVPAETRADDPAVWADATVVRPAHGDDGDFYVIRFDDPLYRNHPLSRQDGTRICAAAQLRPLITDTAKEGA